MASNFRRGSVARIQTNAKQISDVFSARIIDWILINVSLITISGKLYPPRNRNDVITLISTIELYSPRKKNTKIIPLCSVKYPLTSSDSASGRSNGVRLVSARIEIKNSSATGISGIIYQIASCDSVIAV